MIGKLVRNYMNEKVTPVYFLTIFNFRGTSFWKSEQTTELEICPLCEEQQLIFMQMQMLFSR